MTVKVTNIDTYPCKFDGIQRSSFTQQPTGTVSLCEMCEGANVPLR